MATTRHTRHLTAPRSDVYRALLDPVAVVYWKVPPGMTSEVHEWDAREGGRLRVSLTYSGEGVGKSTAHTDTYSGYFAELVPDQKVVEVDEFETDDPALTGPMTITVTLSDAADGGTELVAVHDGLPDGVRAEDNELGWSESLARLAALVERV
ncbi:SRPBCC family protein [Petropleomorpha daqingensis]|uniref:Uncharacterized protein YndB with AHSA1/START domain n=1 Tax=Petropleomorpha daqingensis TaxID=2026353 RepID=A0A853CKY8_9ACTN|nr:SRPBCC family protein [Petropleomorpha daqingensis]NYJ08734.1 uncharacterized protein YndB with AHSA1/START domain [Petropleomorpha daqingensis]